VRLAATPSDGAGELDALAAGDHVGVGALEEAEDVGDANGEPCAAVPAGDPHATRTKARTDTTGCTFLTALLALTLESWFGYCLRQKRRGP
jgi:hypothetical protein